MDSKASVKAARWTTTSTPLTELETASESLTSPLTNSTTSRTGLRESREPRERSSRTLTLKPLETRALTRWDPINPAPPVTRTLKNTHPVEPLTTTLNKVAELTAYNIHPIKPYEV